MNNFDIKKIRTSRPNFVRQEFYKRKNLSKKWKQPKGIQSKTRKKFRSKISHPGAGYGSPKEIKGLHVSGLEFAHVLNKKILENLDPKKHILVIARTLGLKNRLKIVEKAEEAGFKIQNIKNVDVLKEKAEEKKKKKEERLKEKKEKKKKVEEAVAKKEKEEKKGIDAKVEKTPEELEKEEKERHKKILENRE